MNKKSSSLLLYFLTAVVANWVTIEHEFNLCNMTIPGKYAAFHVNDEDWSTYSTSLMFISADTLMNSTSSAIFNLTMWGCTFDCSFSFIIQLNKADSSVSVHTNQTVENYSCLASNYTQNALPTINVTHNDPKPNDQYIFSPTLTLDYCSRGINPDYPGSQMDPAFNVHTCIDRLTGSEDGTYAASLVFGQNSSFSPDEWDVATYHLIDSANRAFSHWNTHHQAIHDAFDDISIKMIPENFVKLAPPPKPSHLARDLGIGIFVSSVVLAFVPGLGTVCGRLAQPAFEVTEDMARISAVAARFNRLDARYYELQMSEESGLGKVISEMENLVEDNLALIERFRTEWTDIPMQTSTRGIIQNLSKLYNGEGLGEIIHRLNDESMRILRRPPPSPPSTPHKGEAEGNDNIGVYSVSFMNHYFISTAMTKLEEALNSSGYSDVSTYFTGASENLLFHFNQTLYDDFFTANMSIIHTFTGTQLISSDQVIADDNQVYTGIRNAIYDTMTASLLSNVLDMYNIFICDPTPSFCGQGCDCEKGTCAGTWYCPRVGKDQCVMIIQQPQLDELQSLRNVADICSNNGTGWDIAHNPSCSTKLFECRHDH